MLKSRRPSSSEALLLLHQAHVLVDSGTVFSHSAWERRQTLENCRPRHASLGNTRPAHAVSCRPLPVPQELMLLEGCKADTKQCHGDMERGPGVLMGEVGCIPRGQGQGPAGGGARVLQSGWDITQGGAPHHRQQRARDRRVHQDGKVGKQSAVMSLRPGSVKGNRHFTT